MLLLIFLPAAVSAEKNVTLITGVNLDKKTLERGYSVRSFDKNFILGVLAGVLAEETKVTIKQTDKSIYNFPAGWSAASDVYEYYVENGKAGFPVVIQVPELTRYQHKIFIWSEEGNRWVENKTTVVGPQIIRTTVFNNNARLVALRNESVMQFGEASWYKYKNCLCAASPDYPKGTLLKVKNLDNGKEVIVKVNDYGPERAVFPLRAIDLDKDAFKKIGKLKQGILKNVLISPVE